MSELQESCTLSIEKDMVEQANFNQIKQVSKVKTFSECNTNTAQTTTFSSTDSASVNKNALKYSFVKESKEGEKANVDEMKNKKESIKEGKQISLNLKDSELEWQQENRIGADEKSSRQYECRLDLKIKWIFTRLLEMNLLDYTHSEIESIVNDSLFLHLLSKEDILQHLIDTNFLNTSEIHEGQIAIEMAQYRINKGNTLQRKSQNNHNQLVQIQQPIGDDRVSEINEDSESQTSNHNYHIRDGISSIVIETNEIHYLKQKTNNRLGLRYILQGTGKPQNRNQYLAEEDGGVTCSICCLSFAPQYFYILLSCNHLFCKGCTLEYLENCINTSKVLKIRCPDENCHNEFTDPILKRILDDKVFEKYQRFKELKIINQDPNLKWCNRPGCTFYCKINQNDPKIICKCGHEMCFTCGNNWHQGKTCDEQISDEFEGAIQKYTISFCPTCKSKIQKASGCNRIMCPICQKYFCWICRAPNISYAHFSHLNVIGCPAGCAAILPFCLVGLAIMTPNYLYWYNEDSETYPNKSKYSFKKVLGISSLLLLLGIVLFPICLIPGSCIVSHRIIKNRL